MVCMEYVATYRATDPVDIRWWYLLFCRALDYRHSLAEDDSAALIGIIYGF